MLVWDLNVWDPNVFSVVWDLNVCDLNVFSRVWDLNILDLIVIAPQVSGRNILQISPIGEKLPKMVTVLLTCLEKLLHDQ